jgi:plastocyanin
MRTTTAAALGAVAALIAAAPAGAQMGHGEHGAMATDGRTVSIQFAAFAPAALDVVTGDDIRWSNDSARAHDVVALDQSFDSGRLIVGGGFDRRAEAEGTIAYYCSLHPAMTGEVHVHDVLLDAPTQRAGSGKPFVLSGRTAAGRTGSVAIEGDDGSGFRPAASAPIQPDGSFRATVVPRTTTSYRAVAGEAQSPAVQLLVLDHTVALTARRRGHATDLTVKVTPAAPHQPVVLQLKLRDRFGWWPVQHVRLDHHSMARLTIRRLVAAPARVLLTLPDGNTELARSATVRVGGP